MGNIAPLDRVVRPLRFYQKDGVRYYLSTDNPALLWQMRLGKSLVVVRAEKVKGTKHILITAPYSALMSWEEELELEGQSYITLDGNVSDQHLKTKTRKGRLTLLDENFHNVKYVLVSKECYRYVPEIADFNWETLVVDEAHCLRNQSKMTKFYQDNFRDVDTRCILTGTPAPESELDYYNLLRFLNHDNWSSKNYWGFKKKLFTEVNHKVFIKPGAYKTIADTVAKHCSVLSRHHVNLGGSTIETVRRIPMTVKVRGIYNKVEQDFALEVNDTTTDTVWATTKHLWLRRLCGGWADQEFISYTKIKELQSLLSAQFKNEQTVIFCDFKKEVRKVCKILSKSYNAAYINGDVKKADRKTIIRQFRAGKIQHLICQPASVKEGSNFSNADIEIFYSLPESGNVFEQVKDRFIDVTYKGSKLIVYLLIDNSIEMIIYKALKRKWSQQEKMKEYIRYLHNKWRV